MQRFGTRYSLRSVGQAKWLNAAKLAVLAYFFFFSVPYAVAVTEFPPHGGPGGGDFREECPSGEYLVGARYRSGLWLDQISIICAPIDAAGLTGQHSHGSPVGGNGGAPGEKWCNPGHTIVGGGILLRSDNRYVRMIDFRCKATTSDAGYLLANVGAPASIFPEHHQSCPTGEAVVGIHGRAGAFVDAIGLICGEIPRFDPSRPEPRPEACLDIEEDPVPEQWKDMLNAHNERRVTHCVAPLSWSRELAEAAQAYAEKCILDTHGSDGENMADAWTVRNGNPVLPALSDREAFENTWYCEVNNYDFLNPQFQGGFTAGCRNVNGHFTQIVWKDTCQLGCGRATCEMTDSNGIVRTGTHWVCRYKPAGNINVHDPDVLKEQVRPPLCKADE
ncbi:CAP domain-containing protein [Rhodoligotrophos defluvii]|uniref:CAP domain-containing protein n=1 Tax=Rhodoligotrophos defluvii TaxID=2561934 RepID=UPI001960596B|nr:CAP domain-containing protein [Rhodoligotrophos defluvii]